VRQSGAGKRRTRRLLPGEEEALLQFASPHLHDVIVGTLASCLRSGELLALQWRDISFERNEITVAALVEGARKTGEGRTIPMTSAMRPLIESRRNAPDGRPHPPTAYAFGNEAGERIKSIKTAWQTCVLKAHNKPVERTTTHALTPASQAALREIDLHEHDLRREAGSRLLESGWQLHEVQLMLGHTNISQTSDYLQASRILLQQRARQGTAA
jgi:integrase